ncbi:hypothetical protein BAE36_25060 [Rhizobium leguminosarum bv. trifolii]|uniref:Uncharacterized protein n=2 Tax=Rhizobium leguminosarum TaxID=384 RepID=A0A1B8R6M5_RHILT|nr:hypothetical protein [Rhizobium leguminosarum bv. trifolii]OBY04482.1 hypothetical protein BAE36_25060 [Rhizobium leguminosarum bv. trifolii]
MATGAEKRKLEQIRLSMETVGRDWWAEADGEATRLMARDPVDDESRPIATFAADAPAPFLTFAVASADFLGLTLDLLDRCSCAYRELAGRRQKQSKNFATECAMKCKSDQAFRQYLIECHDLRDTTDAERIKTRIRSILDIQSMADLNTDEAAAARWKKLRADFEQWRRGR